MKILIKFDSFMPDSVTEFDSVLILGELLYHKALFFSYNFETNNLIA